MKIYQHLDCDDNNKDGSAYDISDMFILSQQKKMASSTSQKALTAAHFQAVQHVQRTGTDTDSCPFSDLFSGYVETNAVKEKLQCSARFKITSFIIGLTHAEVDNYKLCLWNSRALCFCANQVIG